MMKEQIELMFPGVSVAKLLPVIECLGMIDTLTIEDLKVVLIEHLEKDIMLRTDTAKVDRERVDTIVSSRRFQTLLVELFLEVRNLYQESTYHILSETLEPILEELLNSEIGLEEKNAPYFAKEFWVLSKSPILEKQVYEVSYALTDNVSWKTVVSVLDSMRLSKNQIIQKAKEAFNEMPFFVSNDVLKFYKHHLFTIKEVHDEQT